MIPHISKELNKRGKQYIDDELYRINLQYFPKDLGGIYEEICLFLRDDDGIVRGGILNEICWNWLEIRIFMIDEEIRKLGYGSLLKKLRKQLLKKNVISYLEFPSIGLL